MIVLLVFVALHAVVDAAPLQPKKSRRVFFPPNLIKERLNDGDYNIDGGLFESYVDMCSTIWAIRNLLASLYAKVAWGS